MKAIKKQIKPVTIILSILILFQGCTAYKSTPISLEKASGIERKVMVVTSSNERLKFKRIDKENGNYYGLKKQKGNIIRLPLDEKLIKEIKEKDKAKSTILSIVLPVAIIAGAAFIFQDAFKWKSNTIDLSF